MLHVVSLELCSSADTTASATSYDVSVFEVHVLTSVFEVPELRFLSKMNLEKYGRELETYFHNLKRMFSYSMVNMKYNEESLNTAG